MIVQVAAITILFILLINEAVGFSLSSPLNTIITRTCVGNNRKTFAIKASPSDYDDSNNSSDSDSTPFDMNILKQRMDHQQNQYAKLIMEQANYIEQETSVPESVHIILFHPDTPEQNVHTIEMPKGSGNNMILAFEDGADCGMFARNLREMEFVDPSPQETMFEPFAQFCESMSIPVLIVPTGFDLSPPQLNANDDEGREDVDVTSISTILEDEKDDSTIISVIIDDESDSWG